MTSSLRTSPETKAELVTPYHAGVSGTRNEVKIPQSHALYLRMQKLAGTAELVIHTGCCTGWDEVAFFRALSIDDVRVVCHPPRITTRMSPALMHIREVGQFGDRVTWMPPADYDVRNRRIVAESAELMAAPLYPEDHPLSRRSGTWQTIRMAWTERRRVHGFDPLGNIWEYTRIPKAWVPASL